MSIAHYRRINQLSPHISEMTSSRRKYPALSLLGHTASFPDTPKSKTLETFSNPNTQRDYWITCDCGEFTSVCPVTGQPDFAEICIRYIPNDLCIETKSLKFYLASYRNTRAFNEQIVNRILDDIIVAARPRHIIVCGKFSARGGISLSVEVEDGGSERMTMKPQRKKAHKA